MSVDYQTRQAALRQIPVDAVAIVPGANLFYFTGLNYHTSERPIVALFTPDGEFSIIVPQLEAPQLQNRPELAARIFSWSDTEGYQNAFAEAVRALGLDQAGKTLGVDGLTMRVTEWLAFQAVAPDLQVKAVEKDLVHIRAIKQGDEVALMRQAVEVAEKALAQLLHEVEPGMTEREIAQRLNDLMSNYGSEEPAFGTLVQTGPNSAIPHGNVSDRPLEENDFLLIDFGAKVAGYPSDITRTFCLGTPTAEMQKIYETVLAANTAAREATRPGVSMGAIDKAARDVIEAAGYGEYFIHRTGHGLGLDVHEPIPQIASGVADLLEPGMAFTIEPGIYVPGLGGVRIEDNMLVTQDGAEVLTSFPRNLTSR
jgi:Xaa-Pro dipeptidase